MQSMTNSILGLLLVFALFIALHAASISIAGTELTNGPNAQSPLNILYQELVAFKK